MSEETIAEKVRKYICDGDIEYHENIFVDAMETYKSEIVSCTLSGVTDKEESHGVFYIFKDCSVIGCFSTGVIVASPEMVLEGYKITALAERNKLEGKERVKHDS